MLCFLLHLLLSFCICSCDILRVQLRFWNGPRAVKAQKRVTRRAVSLPSKQTDEIQIPRFWRGERGGGKKPHPQFVNLEVPREIFWQIICSVKYTEGNNSILASSGWAGNEDKFTGSGCSLLVVCLACPLTRLLQKSLCWFSDMLMYRSASVNFFFYWQSPNSWKSFTAQPCKLANGLIRSGKVPKYEAPNQLGAYLMRCVNLRCKISCLSNGVTFGSGTSSCVRCIPFLWHRVPYICLQELNPCLEWTATAMLRWIQSVCCSGTGVRSELVFYPF